MTKTDSLTQVGNRHSFYEELTKYIKFSHRLQFPVSVIMFDLDHFKKYNDTYGHLAGDDALKTVAHTIASKVRSTDYVARYGGEEFIILLPDTSQDNALLAAERFRAAVNDIDILECPVSGSFGVTTYFPYQERKVDYDAISEKLTDEADQALYYSKHKGRNCATHFNELANLESNVSASS